ncbi:MAG: hypothetical protein WCA30_11230 [Dermatophilaceae bacterium]
MTEWPQAERPRCSYCGRGPLEPGFIEDAGEQSQGYLRWIAGPLQRGLFGGAARFGRQRTPVHAFRCAACNHLDLFAREDGG